METTFEKIKSFNPCTCGWKKLIAYYKPEKLSEKVEISDIVKSNGIKDAVWAMRAVEDKKSVMLFCADVAESVLHIYEKQYPESKAIRECIKAVRLFAKDKIYENELREKISAAYTAYAAADADAAYAAADAAYAAVYAAADAAYAYAYAYAAYTADAAYAAADAAYAYADARCKKLKEITELLKKY